MTPGSNPWPTEGFRPRGLRGRGWEIQRHGRDVIGTRARSGNKCLSLSSPQDTVGFEDVTAGQRHKLAAGVEFEASVWVKWPGGPDRRVAVLPERMTGKPRRNRSQAEFRPPNPEGRLFYRYRR